MPANTKIDISRYEKYREEKSISDDICYYFAKKILEDLFLLEEISLDEHEKVSEKISEKYNYFIGCIW